MEDGLNKSIDNTGGNSSELDFFPPVPVFSLEPERLGAGSVPRRLPPPLPPAHLGEPRGVIWGGTGGREGCEAARRMRVSSRGVGVVLSPRSLGRSVPGPGQQLKQGTEQRDGPRCVR